MRSDHRNDRRLRGIARRQGVGGTGDARGAGAARLRGAQGRIGAARLRRPDRAHVESAGRSRRRLGAVQAGWRPRPPAAGRGAGHRAGAMAHRACADRGVLHRRGRAGRGSHRVRRRRPQAVDLFVPGRGCRRIRSIASAAARPRGRRRQGLARRPARRVVPLHPAGAGAGRSRVRQSGRRCGGDRAGSDAGASGRSGGSRGRGRALAAGPDARCRRTATLGSAGSEPRADLRTAASGGNAGAVDRTRGRRRDRDWKAGGGRSRPAT